MLRRLAAAVVCVLLLAAVPTGSLYVTTLPTGADVWIDGTYVGRSPLVLGALAGGRHTVGLTKTGWNPLQLEVSVVAGQTTLSSTRLERAKTGGLHPLPGWIVLHGTVRAAFLDGFPAVPANDGTIAVAAGTHELSARTPRGKITRAVMVWPGTRTEVVLQPEAEAVRPSVVAPAEDYVPRAGRRQGRGALWRTRSDRAHRLDLVPRRRQARGLRRSTDDDRLAPLPSARSAHHALRGNSLMSPLSGKNS